MVGSYFLLPDLRYRLHFSRRYAQQILQFGKWIFISSIIYFLSTNYDKLSLGKLVPFELLGVYGITRNFADLFTSLFIRLSDFHYFSALVASAVESSRTILRYKLASIRLMFLLVTVLGISIFCATADLFVRVLFDARYQAAGTLLPILLIGTWISILCAVNRSYACWVSESHSTVQWLTA